MSLYHVLVCELRGGGWEGGWRYTFATEISCCPLIMCQMTSNSGAIEKQVCGSQIVYSTLVKLSTRVKSINMSVVTR